MRPSLLPNLRPLWRDTHTVQLGTDPARAVILEFEDLASIRVLDLLDGSRTDAEVLDDASALGVTNADTLTVLDALRAAGLLVDIGSLVPAGLPEPVRSRLMVESAALVDHQQAAVTARTVTLPGTTRTAGSAMAGTTRMAGPATAGATAVPGTTALVGTTAVTARMAGAESRARTPADAIRRRQAAKVLVTGSEPLVAPIAIALAGAGVGHVHPSVDGCSRPTGVLSAISAAAPGTLVTSLRAGAATMIVRVGVRAPAVPAGRGRRAAVLDVTVRDGVVLVGPLVRPAGSPCGRCLELHRRDRDPAWPVLASQLATAQLGMDACALTTALSGAAFAADEVLAYLDGRGPRTDGAAVELRRPGEIRRRSWPPHPRCDCRRRRPQCNTG